jgi:hypothetical protein
MPFPALMALTFGALFMGVLLGYEIERRWPS